MPTTHPFVQLVSITAENVRAVCDLSVSKEQEHFVTSAAVSLAEAGVYPQAWCRAIEVPGVGLVGFVMLHDTIEEPGYMLWRLLIDRRFQRRGYGRAAVRSVAEYVRDRPGAQHLKVGARRGTGSPRAFYESLGFSPTGEVIDGDEDVLVVELDELQLEVAGMRKLPFSRGSDRSEGSDATGDSFWTRERPKDHVGAASAGCDGSKDGYDVVEHAQGELRCRVADARRQVVGVNDEFEGSCPQALDER